MSAPTGSAPSALDLEHRFVDLDGARLHYVAAGAEGSPILLVHGFPESWWAFRHVIPLLAREHRVLAVDLRGFGDSTVADGEFSSAIAADDLHALIRHLALGPVHLAGQDIAGGAVFRLAATHPEDVRSLIGTEMGLPGFGLEAFADVAHGGSWHIGAIAAPGIADLLLAGREHRLLAEWAFPAMTAVAGAVTEADVAEFARTYARPGGWAGAVGVYRSILSEGDELRRLAETSPVVAPTLAIGGSGGPFTASTLEQVTSGPVESVLLPGVGHHVAMEAPDAFAEAVLAFTRRVDG
jgi:pimeloyl-ACP methyl ester carboxylesterase